MSDWIHCNQCFALPGVNKTFNLTNCGHIFCNDCSNRSENKCYICKVNCTTITLNSRMKPEVEAFFTDPRELSKKHLKELHRVLEFQNGHRTRLCSYNHALVAKARTLAEEYKKTYNKLKDQQTQNELYSKEIQKLKNENCNKQKTNPYENQKVTPDTPGNNFNFRNFRINTPNISPLEKRKTVSIPPTPSPSRLVAQTPPVNGRLGMVPNSRNTISSGGSFRITPNIGNLALQTPSPDQSRFLNSRNLNNSSTQSRSNQINPFVLPRVPESRNYRTPPQNPRAVGPTGSRNQIMRRKARVSPYSPLNT